MLVNGIWTGKWQPVQKKDAQGRFIRQSSAVRNWVTPDGSPGPSGEGGFVAEAGRYRLYVALICPWASRTLLARKLLGLEGVLPVSVVSPMMSDQGWRFGGYAGATEDPLYDANYLHEIYTRHDPHFTGRATVPVLWDSRRNCMVSNESADILRMLNASFRGFMQTDLDLYPEKLRTEIDRLNDFFYERLNNGVYRAGFASSQMAYEEAFEQVFSALNELDDMLQAGGPYVLGKDLTEIDIRLFVTLVRFDVAYHDLFKCNLRRIADYPEVSAYLKRLYHLPGVAETVDFEHIKNGYYSIRALNPNGIVPEGPDLKLVIGQNIKSGRSRFGRREPSRASKNARETAGCISK